MIIIPSVAVIIPSNHDHAELLKIVTAVCCQTIKPTQLIIVDSSGFGALCPVEVVKLCKVNGVKLIYENRKLAFPGQARNIGLGLAKTELIAFIDVQTIPRRNWLESSIKALSSNNVSGVFGSTFFDAKTWFERLIRDSFFGVLPRKTLPGSIFKREVFTISGQFIDWVRAGEDTEWMLRLELLKIPVIDLSDAYVDYRGMIGLKLNSLLSKWYRNYAAADALPHLFPQKLFLWIVLYPLVIFVALNWNYLIANWHEDSPLYIAHITKMATFIPIFGYVFARGVFLPIRRGVRLKDIFLGRFILIASICFMADAIKAYVFTLPRR